MKTKKLPLLVLLALISLVSKSTYANNSNTNLLGVPPAILKSNSNNIFLATKPKQQLGTNTETQISVNKTTIKALIKDKKIRELLERYKTATSTERIRILRELKKEIKKKKFLQETENKTITLSSNVEKKLNQALEKLIKKIEKLPPEKQVKILEKINNKIEKNLNTLSNKLSKQQNNKKLQLKIKALEYLKEKINNKLQTIRKSYTVNTFSQNNYGTKTNLTAEKILKEVQENIVEKLFNTPSVNFHSIIEKAQKREETANTNLQFDINGESLDAHFNIKGLFDKTKPQLASNIAGTIDLNFQKINGKIKTDLDIVTTINKIFFKINRLDTNFSNLNLQAQLNILKQLQGKWFYLSIPTQLDRSTDILVKTKKILKKYPLLTIKKVIGERQYKVKLNHENLIKIIMQLGNLTEEQNKLRKQLNGVDIDAIMNVKNDNTHFTLSGYLISGANKKPFKLEYLPDKFSLSLPKFKIKLFFKNNKFKGYMLVEKDVIKIKFPIEGKLAKDEFYIKVYFNLNGGDQSVNFYVDLGGKQEESKTSKGILFKYENYLKFNFNAPQHSINFFLNTYGKLKELQSIEIKVPEKGTNLEEFLKPFMGAIRQ